MIVWIILNRVKDNTFAIQKLCQYLQLAFLPIGESCLSRNKIGSGGFQMSMNSMLVSSKYDRFISPSRHETLPAVWDMGIGYGSSFPEAFDLDHFQLCIVWMVQLLQLLIQLIQWVDDFVLHPPIFLPLTVEIFSAQKNTLKQAIIQAPPWEIFRIFQYSPATAYIWKNTSKISLRQ